MAAHCLHGLLFQALVVVSGSRRQDCSVRAGAGAQRAPGAQLLLPFKGIPRVQRSCNRSSEAALEGCWSDRSFITIAVSWSLSQSACQISSVVRSRFCLQRTRLVDQAQRWLCRFLEDSWGSSNLHGDLGRCCKASPKLGPHVSRMQHGVSMSAISTYRLRVGSAFSEMHSLFLHKTIYQATRLCPLLRCLFAGGARNRICGL